MVSAPMGRSLNMVAELGQEVSDLQVLVKAYERALKIARARTEHVERELCVAIYDKLAWKAQAMRASRPVVETVTIKARAEGAAEVPPWLTLAMANSAK